MALHDRVSSRREQRISESGMAVPNEFQGVTKDKIRRVLGRLDFSQADIVDAVFALLDNETDSWFRGAPDGTKFCDGAATAHVACHIGILQRGNGKLDREGRDMWIKPLREVAAVEPVLLYQNEFLIGHPIAKSPYSAYRLTAEFKRILLAPDHRWPAMLEAWSQADALRTRREFQAAMAEESRQLVDSGHSALIRACVDHYAARFLAGYEVIYVDDGDGDRITSQERTTLAGAGIAILLGDAMPDVLLWNRRTDSLWIIEAVTSDGEVDFHKVNQMRALATRCGKAGGVGFTTAYRTWKEAAARQAAHGNLAVGSYMWIQADPAKHFHVGSF